MRLIRVLFKYLNCMEAPTRSNQANLITAEGARLFPRTAQSYKADLSPIESGYKGVLSVFLQR
jgi:hypothetical protein